MWDIEAADDYIRHNTIDNENWFENDEVRKTALLNVAKKTLIRQFPDIEEERFVDEAVYLFGAALASAYSDTMIQAQRGVSSFAIDGISFTFMDWARRTAKDFIPDDALDLIGVKRTKTHYTTM